MSDQDWTTVVLQKSDKQKTAGLSSAQAIQKARASGVQITAEKKISAGENKSSHTATGNLRKLEESQDEYKHNTVDASVSRAITQARLARKLTQADLARLINERPQIIQEYESGRAIPNPAIMLKLDKALGTHLPRGKK